MDSQERLKLTRTIWIAMVIGIIAGSAVTAPFLGGWVLGLAFLMVIATIVVTGFIWQWGAPFAQFESSSSSNRDENEKVKRDRIETVLRRLSDTELQNLRDHISSGQLSDEDVQDILEDPGEFKRKR